MYSYGGLSWLIAEYIKIVHANPVSGVQGESAITGSLNFIVLKLQLSLGSEKRKVMNVPKKSERHLFRGLRHKLESDSPEEVAQYEAEVAAHLDADKREEALDRGMEGLASKKPAKK